MPKPPCKLRTMFRFIMDDLQLGTWNLEYSSAVGWKERRRYFVAGSPGFQSALFASTMHMVVFLPIRMGSPRVAGSSHPLHPALGTEVAGAAVAGDAVTVTPGVAVVAPAGVTVDVVVVRTGEVVAVVRTGAVVPNNGLKLCCTDAKGAIKASNTRIL
jgi:hypothetical protein